MGRSEADYILGSFDASSAKHSDVIHGDAFELSYGLKITYVIVVSLVLLA